MSFDLLPSELQIEIFSYLKGLHLKAVRAVCRAFRDNAEPTLFQCVTAAARYQALGALQKISLFPVFQKHVREIVFDGSQYDKLLARRERSYHSLAARIPNLEKGFQWQKRTRWQRYVQLYKEQEEMKTDGILVHTLSRALDWMPNVSCITYSPHPHHLPTEAKDMKGLVQRSLSDSPKSDYTSSKHPFRQLIAALYLSQFAGIRELRADYVGESIANPGTEFAIGIFNLDESEMVAAEFLFQGLEKLVLNMALKVSDKATFGEVTDKFATLLRSSTCLQHLHLHPTHWKSEVGAQPVFARLGLQTTWPKLQTLSLKGIFANEKDLSDMIKRHKKTLTNVKFSKCSLLDGLWADIVDEVVYGSQIRQFVLDRGNERGLSYLNYASLTTWERDFWKYEGHLEVAKDDERRFVSAEALVA
ncbi:uncharacterized protein M421DRAFT_57571 [Didymella exigua CBS 183.55]|uniref:F-box domain-containing protein n=1 Tax=Didymella exigua CBS 183.55 TaxID=1150837 RepID=A0A6A5RST9_9PLEO|nr:uncharacterized protein M421DRAFT_57571 [Didymella exigua CBS 183.55]KAF1930862.1 hypothetical protein M421DRAFT_57571 [Didymella exigua CBS 183.55]